LERLRRAFIAPYSHMDYAWRNTRRYFLMKNAQIFFAVVDYMRNERGYVWCGLHKVHNIMGCRYPWLIEGLKEFLLKGRIDLGGTMTSTPQPHQYEGEAFINNAVYGRKYFERLFGLEALVKGKNQVLHMADPVGHHSQMPQLTKKLGFKYYKFERPWEVYDHKGVPLEFYWEGLDGTRVLCSRTIYSNFHRVGRLLGGHGSVHTDYGEASKRLKELLEELAKHSKTGFILLMDGSDWGLPSLGLLEFVRRWNREEEIMLTVGTLTDYFRDLEKVKDIPVVRGTLDTMGWVAMYGRRSEVLHVITEATNNLLTAEKAAFIAHLLGKPYPEEDIESLWTSLSLMEFHDNLYQFDEDYREEMKTLKEIKVRAEEITEESLRWVAGRVSMRGDGIPIMVFNPLSWKRRDIVEVDLKFEDTVKAFSLVDFNGKPQPYQILEAEMDGATYKRAKILVATDAPPLGYKALYVVPSKPPRFETTLRFSKGIFENRFYRIKLDDGRIVSVYDKVNGREIVAPSRYSANEILCEKGDVRLLVAKFDRVYGSDVERVELVEEGPVRMRLRIKCQTAGNPIEQYVTLYDDVPRIDFETVIDCKVKEARFRTVFPLNFSRGRLYCDFPFGAEEREPNDEPLVGMERSYGWEGSSGVTHALSWCEVENGDYGVALLNIGDNGYRYEDNNLSLILHLSSEPEKLEHYRVCRLREMAGLGRYVFRYSLYPHVGGWRDGEVCRRSFEYRHPLVGIQASRGRGGLPQEKTFLHIEPSNLILTSLKIEDGEANIRFYDAHGKPVVAEIETGFTLRNPRKTDFLGNVIQKIEVEEFRRVKVKPHEIVNLRMEIEPVC